MCFSAKHDCARLIYARTILDHHYDQQIDSAQTKLQFVVEKYNDGFDVLVKFGDVTVTSETGSHGSI
jgi:hypothetical protein